MNFFPLLGMPILKIGGRSEQFGRRIPKNVAEVHDFVVDYLQSFFLQQGLHLRWRAEMMFPGKLAIAVHHPVCRYILRATVHRPTNHARTHFGAEILRNGAVAGSTPFGDQSHHLIYIVEKIGLSLALFLT